MNPVEDGPKRAVTGRLVKVLVHGREDRGMVLEPFAARCVRRGEVHELVGTDQRGGEAGDRVDRVGFLGFVELDRGGVLDRGDLLLIGGRPIGRLLGFDACHLPNHYNILVSMDEPATGAGLGLEVEAEIRFEQGSAES